MLNIQNAKKSYAHHCALHDVSFDIQKGECVGLVGESGSGKSTLAKLILALERCDSGSITIHGKQLASLKGRELRKARRHVQMVFQDSSASFNSKLPIWKSVVEPLENFPEANPFFLQEAKGNKRLIAELLFAKVGLSPALLNRYPHELSGGQRQRAAIARGISLQPDLLVCDEVTSSLDVSVQAQILNLLKQLQQDLQMSYLFISHDIAAVQFMCDRTAVLQHGFLVDMFAADDLFSSKRHAYTKQLIAASLEPAEKDAWA